MTTLRVGYLTEDQFLAILKSKLELTLGGSFAPLVHTHVIADVTGLQAALDAKVDDAEKGSAGGVATLDGAGKVPTTQMPAIALTEVFVVNSEAAQLALTAEEGDVAVRTDLNKSFIHDGGTAGTMADWQELLTPTDAVLSVNGYTGAVSLTAADVGAQPSDADLAAIAALSTTAFGRALLTLADAAALRAAAALGTAATQNTDTSGANVPLMSTANTWTNEQTGASGLSASGYSFSAGDKAQMGFTGGVGYFQAYNSGTNTFFPVKIRGSHIYLAPQDALPQNYANDAAAAVGGIPVGAIYRNGSVLMVRAA